MSEEKHALPRRDVGRPHRPVPPDSCCLHPSSTLIVQRRSQKKKRRLVTILWATGLDPALLHDHHQPMHTTCC